MKEHLNKNVLVTTSTWFIAPDGKEYRAVYGELKAIHEAGSTLGFIPNRSHANWFIEIGNMIIMGCQVMYFIQTDHCSFDKAKHWTTDNNGKIIEQPAPCKIYNANEES
jgi:hypothetical protein